MNRKKNPEAKTPDSEQRSESGSNTTDNRLINNLSFENGERIATTRQIEIIKNKCKVRELRLL
mgnify:FL=1